MGGTLGGGGVGQEHHPNNFEILHPMHWMKKSCNNSSSSHFNDDLILLILRFFVCDRIFKFPIFEFLINI